MGSNGIIRLHLGLGCACRGALRELPKLCNWELAVILRMTDGIICIFKIHKGAQPNQVVW